MLNTSIVLELNYLDVLEGMEDIFIPILISTVHFAITEKNTEIDIEYFDTLFELKTEFVPFQIMHLDKLEFKSVILSLLVETIENPVNFNQIKSIIELPLSLARFDYTLLEKHCVFIGVTLNE